MVEKVRLQKERSVQKSRGEKERPVDPSLRPPSTGVVSQAGAEAEYADDQSDDEGRYVAPVEGLGPRDDRDEGEDDEDKRRPRDFGVITSRHFFYFRRKK